MQKIAMFDNLFSLFKEDEVLDERLKTLITQHLQSLQTELIPYIPELKESEALLARNPFSAVLDVAFFMNVLCVNVTHIYLN